MGIEYEIFDHARREYIGLGKRRWRGGYQMPAGRIKAFCRGRGKLELLPDSHHQPTDDDDSWRCVGRWWWEEWEYHLHGEGLMSRDGYYPLAAPGAEPPPSSGSGSAVRR